MGCGLIRKGEDWSVYGFITYLIGFFYVGIINDILSSLSMTRIAMLAISDKKYLRVIFSFKSTLNSESGNNIYFIWPEL